MRDLVPSLPDPLQPVVSDVSILDALGSYDRLVIPVARQDQMQNKAIHTNRSPSGLWFGFHSRLFNGFHSVSFLGCGP